MATSLANFIATTQHRRPGQIMYHAGFTDDLQRRVQQHVGEGNDIGRHLGFFKSAGVGMRRPGGLPPLDFSRYWQGQDLPPGTTFDGKGMAMVPSGFYHFWGIISPLRNARSLADIENYPMDDMTDWDTLHLAGEVEKAHAAGLVVQAWVGHMYENAWQIRGYEEFLVDLMDRPEWADCLLERYARQNMIAAVAYAKAGVDWISCGDDVANQNALMFAPDTWRRLFHSKWAGIWNAVKSINPNCRIWYHSDGNVGAIVGDLVEAGVDILNPVQPECVDVDAIHSRYGHCLTFDGLIGTQSTMPFGKPEDVRARVKEIIEKYGRNGGLIVSPTHVLEPEVPVENIEAMCRACREFGSFE